MGFVGTRSFRIALTISTALSAIAIGPAAWAQQVPASNAGTAPTNVAVTAPDTATGTAPDAAPDAAPDSGAEGEPIVVRGFRGSLSSALNIKRNETATVDAIKAEDIAEFPDLNLAESLQRIPGVAISRVNGEGRNISVRGLGPEYTRVRINGMEAIGTTGGTDNSGGVNRGRGFDFNIFSSDLFNSLAVRNGRLYARLGYAGRPFTLVLAKDKRSWRTV